MIDLHETSAGDMLRACRDMPPMLQEGELVRVIAVQPDVIQLDSLTLGVYWLAAVYDRRGGRYIIKELEPTGWRKDGTKLPEPWHTINRAKDCRAAGEDVVMTTPEVAGWRFEIRLDLGRGEWSPWKPTPPGVHWSALYYQVRVVAAPALASSGPCLECGHGEYPTCGEAYCPHYINRATEEV